MVQELSSYTILVPKLCLGTHLAEKLRFEENHTYT